MLLDSDVLTSLPIVCPIDDDGGDDGSDGGPDGDSGGGGFGPEGELPPRPINLSNVMGVPVMTTKDRNNGQQKGDPLDPGKY